jgi:transcriptional regulator with PAS, ATPase and Fis domain
MQPNENLWVREFPGAITVCDPSGIILEMNDQSALLFAKDGGRELIGKNVLDCHPEPSRTKLEQMLKQGKTNVYSIEKNGVKRLIYQSPWYVNGQYAGFVEIGLEVPFEMPHFLRT